MNTLKPFSVADMVAQEINDRGIAARAVAARWMANALDCVDGTERQAFHDALLAILEREAAGCGPYNIHLCTDPVPSSLLSEAADTANLSELYWWKVFPPKCSLKIQATGRVLVWPCYGAEWEQLYPVE